MPRASADHFFWTGDGSLDGVVGSWRKRVGKLFRLAGVSGAHPHRFRDTFATELLLTGTPMEGVSILLGHQSVKITRRSTTQRGPIVDSDRREADLQRAWDRDPIVLLETKRTQHVRGKVEAVN